MKTQRPRVICTHCGHDATEEHRHYRELQETSLCFECNFWFKRFNEDRSASFVTEDKCGRRHHYMIGEANNLPACMKGMGGTRYVVKFADGREVETDNLWHQGEIPAHFFMYFPVDAILTEA